uniref:TNFR-Cys domain-containing protein n=1 Tax=Scleropages formosus TaxID=113540 RepID=A0A8C9W4Q3_SCLFO
MSAVCFGNMVAPPWELLCSSCWFTFKLTRTFFFFLFRCVCCPMCTPGYYVRNDCTSTDITICRPCTVSTFTDEPNGRRNCSACVVCEQDLGLKTVKECKPSADTVCGALEGNYCIDPYEGGCRAAQKHTTCKPGHFIKHPGTEYNDTVCENCTGNYFSNGSSLSCTPHTR